MLLSFSPFWTLFEEQELTRIERLFLDECFLDFLASESESHIECQVEKNEKLIALFVCETKQPFTDAVILFPN